MSAQPCCAGEANLGRCPCSCHRSTTRQLVEVSVLLDVSAEDWDHVLVSGSVDQDGDAIAPYTVGDQLRDTLQDALDATLASRAGYVVQSTVRPLLPTYHTSPDDPF